MADNKQMMNQFSEVKFLLDQRVIQYNHTDFIDTDPIQIPHRFGRKEDIEIAGFLAAAIAWGQRKSIINNANRLMVMMDNSPYEFILEGNPASDWQYIQHFVHRTFNAVDCLFFLSSLRNIYVNHGGLESVFIEGFHSGKSIFSALTHFRKIFFEIPHEQHVRKHISDVTANSSAKRLNMFLRWMVREDENRVDFGLWKDIPKSALMLPLDVHTSNVGRALGILQRKQNDWKAVEEITSVLRSFDPEDPIKYDYALFGIGAFELKSNRIANNLIY
ncbi:MAG: TIGR02757 family protein [Paludibacter sp.]|nr:TIGR02757 family protein [Paludibacter sp.]